MSRRDREIVAPLVAQINAVRREFGGCEFTEAQMRGFCFQRSIGSRATLVTWMEGWRDAYRAAGPKLASIGLTIDEADRLWGLVPESAEGHAAFGVFVEGLVLARWRA